MGLAGTLYELYFQLRLVMFLTLYTAMVTKPLQATRNRLYTTVRFTIKSLHTAKSTNIFKANRYVFL